MQVLVRVCGRQAAQPPPAGVENSGVIGCWAWPSRALPCGHVACSVLYQSVRVWVSSGDVILMSSISCSQLRSDRRVLCIYLCVYWRTGPIGLTATHRGFPAVMTRRTTQRPTANTPSPRPVAAHNGGAASASASSVAATVIRGICKCSNW